jgi:Lipase (class 3)
MTYCISCKKKTSTEDEHIVNDGKRSRKIGTCTTCGKSKSQFIARQGGKGEIDAKLSQEAYKDNSADNVDGYQLDKELSNRKTKVYHNPETKKTVVAHRGTKVTDKKDLLNDVLVATGLLSSSTSNRVKNATDIAKKAESKYKDSDIKNTGHSLGGTVASEVGKSLSVKNSAVETYNKGASPLDIGKNIYNKVKCSLSNSDECKKAKNQTHNITGIDPISVSNLLHAGKTNIVKPTKLNVHSLSNFKGGCKGNPKCGCK